MQPFSFSQARSEDEAIAQLAEHNGRAIAGGTTLVDLMKLEVEVPHHLVDINALPLNKIEAVPGGGLRIGAMVRNSDLAHHPIVVKNFPVLSQALLSGASAQLRNMATTGGNLMQRTRCYYFRDPSYAACNKRKSGSGCAALEGYNRIHAILGGSEHCVATHPSDMAVALVALDAVVRIRGPRGEREVRIADFHKAPGSAPHVETAAEPGELITEVMIPGSPFAARSAYAKLRDRASYEFALASAAVALDLADGTIRDARVALGGVATKPWRSPEAEQELAGASAGEHAFRAAAEAAIKSAKPLRYNGFKVGLAKMALIRALNQATSMLVERDR
ncbi:MAG: FAD binding domain-containing protein [Terriglobia bacterium]